MRVALLIAWIGLVGYDAVGAVNDETTPKPSGAAAKEPGNTGAPSLATRYRRYGVRPGDVLELSFSRLPEFNQTAPVQPDGFVTLREAGDLYVQGKTVPEVQRDIIEAYSKILREPLVTVLLKEFEKPHFTVGGQVGRPGKYDLRDDVTVSEGIATAGGLTEKSKHSQVLLFRRVNEDWVEVKQLDIKSFEKGNISEDVHLRPGDMVFVPQNRISKIKQFMPVWSISTYVDPTRF